MRIIKYIASAILLAFSAPIFGQNNGQVVDKIIAKVDDKIILKSDLESAYISFLSSPESREFQGDARCIILSNFVESKVMAVMANIDSTIIDEARVDYEIQSRRQQIIQRFGSEQAIQQAYGKSVDQIMTEIRSDIREQLTVQAQEDAILSDVRVTPREVRQFFNNIPKDSLPLYSMEYEVGLIIKEPEVSNEEKDRIREELIQLREQALSRQNFEILATMNSDGPSKVDGGNLGFTTRGMMDPAYEAGALSLKPGEISMPVESSFGIHLIQLLEKRGNEYNSRHIVKTPKPDEDDIKKTEDFLKNLRNEILNDSLSFESAAQQYSDDDRTKSNGGFLSGQFGSLRVPADNIEPELFFEIDKMKEGEISLPSRLQVGPGSKDEVVRIIYFKKRVPPHRANLSDDYEKLKAATTQLKKGQRRTDYLAEKMKEVYLEVDPEFNRCNIIKN